MFERFWRRRRRERNEKQREEKNREEKRRIEEKGSRARVPRKGGCDLVTIVPEMNEGGVEMGREDGECGKEAKSKRNDGNKDMNNNNENNDD